MEESRRSGDRRWTGRGSLGSGRGAECQAPGLRQAREAAGLTQAELVEKAGGYSVDMLNRGLVDPRSRGNLTAYARARAFEEAFGEVMVERSR